MVASSFIANNGLCGGPLGSCNPTPSLSLQPDAKDKEYEYTMKVTENVISITMESSYLELLTGRTPIQPLDQCDNLVTCVRNYIRNQSLSPVILDVELNQQDETIVSQMITVLKIALISTSMSPSERPTLTEVV
ncbi:hypothetical protein V6N12_024011 [Hibiscus sabdariffa]|uniref:Uncharacterized protein n=1 Tax=Hibiscus sabdariffa TaxID=183260 RepID=A0ABR2FZS2_9ROSI